jgi:hypothetical protein
MSFFIVIMAASWHKDMISAPEQSVVYERHLERRAQLLVAGIFTREDMAATSISSATLIDFIRMRRISSRPTASGGPTYRRRSSLPGRMRAESCEQIHQTIQSLSRHRLTMTSGRFVAATTVTPAFSCCTPSISVSRLMSTPSDVDVVALDREVAIASISSKNRMHGAAPRALRNSSRTARSESPTYLLSSCGRIRTSDST